MSDFTYKYIARKLTTDAILCQLAEEAAELAQAALKLRRVLDGTNPTPMNEREALDNMLEEIADVQNAFNVIKCKWGNDFREPIEHTISEKRYRWAERLQQKDLCMREQMKKDLEWAESMRLQRYEQKERAGNAEG